MATVTHIISSHYDPEDRERLERETGQQADDLSDPWQTESSSFAQRRIRATPTFVPATISYDEWGVPLHTSAPTAVPEKPATSSSSTAEWYRSLTTASSREAPLPQLSSASSPRSQGTRPPQPQPRRERVTKNDWFIRRALHSEPCTKTSTPAMSLADLLVRDPPSMPLEGRYIPPVWVHIGPSNRGFSMLQRSGWNEGEGLGAHAVRRVTRASDADVYASSFVGVGGAVTDVRNTPEVIDLTLPDSEAPEDVNEDDAMQRPVPTQAYVGGAPGPHMQRSLLTPLPTVLKADRLGIGLKARTEGPYKQSRKRVTHGAAALAAHIRSAEEMQRKKATVGKGKRGFAKIHKRDEDERKAMLAYFNE